MKPFSNAVGFRPRFLLKLPHIFVCYFQGRVAGGQSHCLQGRWLQGKGVTDGNSILSVLIPRAPGTTRPVSIAHLLPKFCFIEISCYVCVKNAMHTSNNLPGIIPAKLLSIVWHAWKRIAAQEVRKKKPALHNATTPTRIHLVLSLSTGLGITIL